eukprot:scaffold3651_cov61-Phaeocystis_antarctica.AAC.7
MPRTRCDGGVHGGVGIAVDGAFAVDVRDTDGVGHVLRIDKALEKLQRPGAHAVVCDLKVAAAAARGQPKRVQPAQLAVGCNQRAHREPGIHRNVRPHRLAARPPPRCALCIAAIRPIVAHRVIHVQEPKVVHLWRLAKHLDRAEDELPASGADQHHVLHRVEDKVGPRPDSIETRQSFFKERLARVDNLLQKGPPLLDELASAV